MYNYLPRNEDELELKEGDVVDVMEKCDDGWFVGKRRGYRLLCISHDTRYILMYMHTVKSFLIVALR